MGRLRIAPVERIILLGSFPAGAGSAEPFLKQKNFAYVLPGAERSWPLSAPTAEMARAGLLLTATIDGKRAEVEVGVE